MRWLTILLVLATLVNDISPMALYATKEQRLRIPFLVLFTRLQRTLCKILVLKVPPVALDVDDNDDTTTIGFITI